MNKKHLAAAFAVFAATSISFSAFAASVDANARAYERAAQQQAQSGYSDTEARRPMVQTGYTATPPQVAKKNVAADPYAAGDMTQQRPVSKDLGDPIFVAPQTTAIGLQIMDPIPTTQQPVHQETVASLNYNNNGNSYVNSYKANQLNAFDVLLNGKSYTYNLPAYTNGYQVKTASSYNHTGNGIANVFSTNVITEAVVNNQSLRITVNMTQPTAVAAGKLMSMQKSGNLSAAEIATLFAYNESYDGVKQAAYYDVFNNAGRFIVVKSGAVTVPNGAQHPYATAMFALTDDTVAAVTVSGNTSDAYELVKGTAYAIAQSAKVANNNAASKAKR